MFVRMSLPSKSRSFRGGANAVHRGTFTKADIRILIAGIPPTLFIRRIEGIRSALC